MMGLGCFVEVSLCKAGQDFREEHFKHFLCAQPIMTVAKSEVFIRKVQLN